LSGIIGVVYVFCLDVDLVVSKIKADQIVSIGHQEDAIIDDDNEEDVT
jgi:hypothetical protein